MPDFESLDAETQRRLDRICDEFDRQLQLGNPPSVQDLLVGFDRNTQRVLFHELIRLELDSCDSVPARVAQFREEFPQFESEIDLELETRRQENPAALSETADETVAHGTSSDTNPVSAENLNKDSPTHIGQYVLREVGLGDPSGDLQRSSPTNHDLAQRTEGFGNDMPEVLEQGASAAVSVGSTTGR